MPRHCHPSNDGSPRGRIVWVLDRLGMGGAERLAVRFAAAASPWRIELVVLHTPPQEALAAWWGPQLAALGDRLHCLPMRSLGDARGWWRLLRLLAGWQPLLVHTHLRYATVWGGAAARLLQRPYVTTVHLGPRPDPDRRQRAAAACERYSRRRAARVIYVSAAQRQAWGAVAARERAVVIGNGVALPPSVPTPRLRRQEREALGLPPAATVFTTVAMVHAAKGWRTWLAACTSIAAQRPGALFVWVGGGDELAALQRGVEASPARRQFLLPGTRNDVSRWLAASDIFLFPSHEEAQPTAVLEAMAAGLPIIATSVPSIAEVLGGCGRLVPVEDAPALAAAGLDWSGPGCAAAAAGATAARRRAEQTLGECSWRQRLLDLYEDVLAH